MKAVIYFFATKPITLPSGSVLTPENCVCVTTNVGAFDLCVEYAQQHIKGFSDFQFDENDFPVLETITLPDDWQPEPAYIVCQEHLPPVNPTQLCRFRFSDHGAKCYQKAIWMYARLISLPSNRSNTFFICDQTWKRVVETPQTKAANNPPPIAVAHEKFN